MEERDEDIFIDFWSKVANKDTEFRSTVITAKKSVYAQWEDLTSIRKQTYRRSASPPPEAQLSLNGRDVFGIIEPLRDKALAAA